MRFLITFFITLVWISSAQAQRLDDTFVGPEYPSDDAAISAFLAEFKSADTAGMQSVWSRMMPAQKLAANEVIRDWMRTLEDDERDRIDPGYQLLKQVDWAAIYGRAAAIRETAGLLFGDLRGLVVDEVTNEPVEGLTINATHVEHGLGPKMSMSKITDVTNAQGYFELTQIPEGDLKLFGLKANYAMKMATATVVADQVSEVRLTAKPLGRIKVTAFVSGEVTDAETGQPILNASVFLDKRAKRTPGHGRFLFDTKPGIYQLRVEHRDYLPASAEVTAPGSGGIRHDFALQPITTGIITGVAVDRETGKVLANATINVGGHAITTDAQGRFRVEEVESGEVAVRAESSGYKASTETIVLQARTTRDARLELDAIKVGDVAGVVSDAVSGAALGDVSVSASGVTATTDGDGRFRLIGVAIGEVSVLGAKAIYKTASTPATVPPGGLVEVTLALQPITDGTVQVLVKHALTGAPLADSEVRIAGQILHTDASGRVVLEGVTAGEVAVDASRTAFRPSRQTAVLGAGTTLEMALALEPIVVGDIVGIAVDSRSLEPIAGVTVQLDGKAIQTTADGRFKLAGVSMGPGLLTASKAVYRDASQPVEIIAAEVVEVRIALDPITTGRIKGRVIDAATDQPIVGARVSSGEQTIATSADGVFEFVDVPAGTAGVNAAKPVYTSGTAQVEVEAAQVAELTIALKPITTGVVRGLVVNATTGESIADAVVSVGGQGARSNADGSFAIVNVPAGEHALGADKQLYEPRNMRTIVTAAGQADVKVELVPITYGTIRGEVRHAVTQAPLAGVSVQAGKLSATTDAQGRFSIERIPAGSVNLTAQKPVFEGWRRSLDLEAATTSTLTIELHPITYGDIVGVVVDKNSGRPLSGASVNVTGRALSTDTEGRFRFEKVEAGSVLVAAEKDRYLGAQTSVTLEPAGEAQVRLALDPITVGRVEGKVVDAKTGRPISGARVSLASQSMETGAEGTFSFDNITAGDLRVAARHADYGDGSAVGRLQPAETLRLEIALDLRREDVTELETALASKGTIDLYGIHFDSGSDQFKPSSLGTLNAVLKVMERAPERRFVIAGHTDSDGSDAANQGLSERRARTVIEWLVGKGVARERLQAVGFGEHQPAAPNDTDSGKALNRRVQLSFEK